LITRVRRWVRTRPADVIDLFVYVVVLNLAIEYAPAVISESFTLSLLTAALLKLALEVVILLKGPHPRQAPGRRCAAREARRRGVAVGRRGRQSSSCSSWSTSSSAMP
jgi:hypothetical protein